MQIRTALKSCGREFPARAVARRVKKYINETKKPQT